MKTLLKNREWLLAGIIILLIIGFSLRSPGFERPANLVNIFNDTSILIILALGQMTVILTKSIDLSVAANLAFTGMAVAMTNAAFPGVPLPSSSQWLLELVHCSVRSTVFSCGGLAFLQSW